MDEETAEKLGIRNVRDDLRGCKEILEHLDHPELKKLVDRAYKQAQFKDILDDVEQEKEGVSFGITIRKVKALDGRAKEKAKDKGYEDKDLVLIQTKIDKPPEYNMAKIEGSPTEFLLDEASIKKMDHWIPLSILRYKLKSHLDDEEKVQEIMTWVELASYSSVEVIYNVHEKIDLLSLFEDIEIDRGDDDE